MYGSGSEQGEVHQSMEQVVVYIRWHSYSSVNQDAAATLAKSCGPNVGERSSFENFWCRTRPWKRKKMQIFIKLEGSVDHARYFQYEFKANRNANTIFEIYFLVGKETPSPDPAVYFLWVSNQFLHGLNIYFICIYYIYTDTTFNILPNEKFFK